MVGPDTPGADFWHAFSQLHVNLQPILNNGNHAY